ncbi:sulfite exporter TauE/SafE family protein [Candidatus Peregrinibacteria bacterium]|nr:sulfite exporter TauE/SafE family protein [Candidatus Peregrinibacteria bacterium]
MEFIFILVTTFVATALSAMSGGGSSMIILPVFLWLGIPFPLATATQKLSATFWVLPAAYNYLKNRKINWRFIVLFSGIGLFGSYFGVLLVLNLNQSLAKIMIGAFVLLLVTHTYFKKDLGLKEKKGHSKYRQFMAYPFSILLGFYESIFGAGNGIAFAIISFYTRGFDFIDALGYYFAIAFPWVLFATVILMGKGFYSFPIMVPATVGSILGGFVGSKYAIYKGNKFIKNVFVIIGGILGIKLLIGF